MSLFARFSKPRLVDPTFGALMFGKHGWSGEAPWLDGSRVLVSLERDQTAPLEADRNAFTSLRKAYASLKPELRRELFALWQPEMTQPHWEGEAPKIPEALWHMLELNSVTVRADSSIELLYAFGGDFWPDGMFTVEVKGSNVRALSLDD